MVYEAMNQFIICVEISSISLTLCDDPLWFLLVGLPFHFSDWFLSLWGCCLQLWEYSCLQSGAHGTQYISNSVPHFTFLGSSEFHTCVTHVEWALTWFVHCCMCVSVIHFYGQQAFQKVFEYFIPRMFHGMVGELSGAHVAFAFLWETVEIYS